MTLINCVNCEQDFDTKDTIAIIDNNSLWVDCTICGCSSNFICFKNIRIYGDSKEK